jgi:pyruvate formate lyase activating enzyme
MDRETNQEVTRCEEDLLVHRPAAVGAQSSRRNFLRAGAGTLAAIAAGGGTIYYVLRRAESLPTAEIFPRDAPQGEFWQAWQARGWVTEARHYLKLGRNVQCKMCPNECLLEPEDRSHCRVRINKDGTLLTLAYGNPCAFHLDPIEKKPLFHFLPGTTAFSIATAGCVYRCLNCQNWDISQSKPDETKDPLGDPQRLDRTALATLRRVDPQRVSMFTEDVVALAEYLRSDSIAYTYSEPIAWYEYMFDTARQAKAQQIKNLWITCGSINEEPLVELCSVIDAANVNLKGFDPEIYRQLNSGSLDPILNTLKTLKRENVWFEVTNLVVPTYTDKLDMIRRMCDWLVTNLGPDYPLHFSRFHPEHKLTHLPPTPIDMLVQARDAARSCGLHHVYIGNVRELEDAETTYCPGCRKAVIERAGFYIRVMRLDAGKCASCGTAIAGVWSA